MITESKQLLVSEVVGPQLLCPEGVDIWQEQSCPDCDCTLDVSYDSENNPKYYCDNCGSAVLGAVALSADDMDITQETEA
jgi:hypothetical protein